MKNYSLQPTDENVRELLCTDPISRNRHVFRFVELLNNIDECCTIAINGEWGAGKTFFVRQVKLILDAQNPQSLMDEEARDAIKGFLPDTISDMESYATVYYDAWTHDNDDDPILSLVHAAISSGQSDFSEEKQHSMVDSAAALAEVLTGRNVGGLLKEAKGKDRLEALKNADSIRGMVKEFLDALVQEHGNRLVVFVDELDRCKPDYAIRFLERVKHYFNDDRITFVFSVSISQLECTVRNYYGADFNAVRYLDKFFDLRMSLPRIDYDSFVRKQLSLKENSRLDAVCIETIKYFGLSLRECERYVRLIKISARAAINRINDTYSDTNGLLFAITYFVPIILGLQMTDITAYKNFVTGTSSGPMIKILTSSRINLNQYWFLDYNETYDKINRTIQGRDGNKPIAIEDRLEEIYTIAFSKIGREKNWEKSIGDMCFSEEILKSIDEVVALLSDFSDYKAE